MSHVHARRRRFGPAPRAGAIPTMLLAVLVVAGACQAPVPSATPTSGVPLTATATGGEVPCAPGCVAWFLVRDTTWKAPAEPSSQVHPARDRDGQFPTAFDGQRTVATGEMTGGRQRIEFGAYIFAIAYSGVDDSRQNAFSQTTYVCQQRVNVPADATAVAVRVQFGPSCSIEADIAVP